MKLLTMAKKNFWTGMLAIVLVFGMTAIACDNGTTNSNGGNGRTDPALNGTWDGTSSDVVGETIILNNGNFESFYGGEPFSRGTFTTSGNTITTTITHLHANLVYNNWGLELLPGFHSRTVVRSAKILAFGASYSDYIDVALDWIFYPQTYTFNVSGNTLTIAGLMTYTRRI